MVENNQRDGFVKPNNSAASPHTQAAGLKPTPIQVLAVRPLDGTSSVRAFVDLQVGGFKILSAKIVKQDNAKAWLAMPSMKGNGAGRRAWITPVEIVSKSLRDRLTQAAVAAWQASDQLQHESSKS
jgi:DNA-binding cell septation regulator SpoVG